MSVYYAFIQSYQPYGVFALGCDTGVEKLLIFRNRVVRIICKDRLRTHYNPVFKSLGVLIEPSLYSMQFLLYVRSSLVHDHFLWQSIFHRVRQCDYQPTINSKLTFNLDKKMYILLEEIKCLDDKKFKIKLKLLLFDLII